MTRNVTYWIPTQPQPTCLVVYFHGWESSPLEATLALPIPSLIAAGCLVIAPAAGPVPDWRHPWDVTATSPDLLLLDAIVACPPPLGAVVAGVPPWASGTFLAGFSAGAVFVSYAAFSRSAYVAGVVSFSGGLAADAAAAPSPRAPATLALHGGPADVVLMTSFMDATLALVREEAAADPTAFLYLCNHTLGHSLPTPSHAPPPEFPAAFVAAHRFGAPSPWAGSPPTVPAGLAALCAPRPVAPPDDGRGSLVVGAAVVVLAAAAVVVAVGGIVAVCRRRRRRARHTLKHERLQEVGGGGPAAATAA